MQGNTCKVQCAPPQAAWCRTTLLQVTDCSPTCVSGASVLWAWPLLQAVKCRTDRRRHTAAGTIRRTSSRSARCINEQAEVNYANLWLHGTFTKLLALFHSPSLLPFCFILLMPT